MASASTPQIVIYLKGSMKPYKPHEFKVLRVRECETMTELLDTPDQVARYWQQNIPKSDWFDPAKEALVVLVLNTRKRIIGHNLVALGSLDTCPVTMLHIFRPAIVAAGSSIVIAHNHPSGEAEPSAADIKVTRDVIRAGQLLKIEVLDHIILGHNTHASLRALGHFWQ
jgi:DNA repair protein RadC